MFEFYEPFCRLEIQSYVNAKKLVLYKNVDFNETYSCMRIKKEKAINNASKEHNKIGICKNMRNILSIYITFIFLKRT